MCVWEGEEEGWEEKLSRPSPQASTSAYRMCAKLHLHCKMIMLLHRLPTLMS